MADCRRAVCIAHGKPDTPADLPVRVYPVHAVHFAQRVGIQQRFRLLCPRVAEHAELPADEFRQIVDTAGEAKRRRHGTRIEGRQRPALARPRVA